MKNDNNKDIQQLPIELFLVSDTIMFQTPFFCCLLQSRILSTPITKKSWISLWIEASILPKNLSMLNWKLSELPWEEWLISVLFYSELLKLMFKKTESHKNLKWSSNLNVIRSIGIFIKEPEVNSRLLKCMIGMIKIRFEK